MSDQFRYCIRGCRSSLSALTVGRLADMASNLCAWDTNRLSVRGTSSRVRPADGVGLRGRGTAWQLVGLRGLCYLKARLEHSAAGFRLDSGSSPVVEQADAASRSYAGVLVSTDPPYYDNIGYADLSDFFYVWLRRSLGGGHARTCLATMLTPKADELVADPYRHGGSDAAAEASSKLASFGSSTVFAATRRADYPDDRLLRLQAERV